MTKIFQMRGSPMIITSECPTLKRPAPVGSKRWPSHDEAFTNLSRPEQQHAHHVPGNSSPAQGPSLRICWVQPPLKPAAFVLTPTIPSTADKDPHFVPGCCSVCSRDLGRGKQPSWGPPLPTNSMWRPRQRCRHCVVPPVSPSMPLAWGLSVSIYIIEHGRPIARQGAEIALKLHTIFLQGIMFSKRVE